MWQRNRIVVFFLANVFPSKRKKHFKEFSLWCNGISGISEAWSMQTLSPAWHNELKDPALLQLWCRSQLWSWSDPRPGDAICCGAAKKEKKEQKEKSTLICMLVRRYMYKRIYEFLQDFSDTPSVVLFDFHRRRIWEQEMI